jgi:malignant T-cell-amplified sequence
MARSLLGISLKLRTYTLSKSARDQIIESIAKISGMHLKSKELKISEAEEGSLAIIFDEKEKLYLGRRGEKEIFPLLRDEFIVPTLPAVTVDSGAVKFVINGANIMRPGITKIEGGFAPRSLLVVREERHGKAIAIGKSSLSSSDMSSAAKGSVVENIHYVGDKFWEMLKELAPQ